MNSKFRHYNLNQSKRRVLNVSHFAGVDYSSQKFNVSSSRAIDIKNFIYRDGVVQKRHGYEQIAKHGFGNFNGIWRFLAEDEKYHIVAHIGKKLYKVGEDLKTFTQLSAEEFEDYRSFAFVGSNRLWFLGGNQYVVVKFNASYPNGIVEKVEDSDDTFVPTTSISIPYQNAKSSNQAFLDYPNALTMFRKNNCISGSGKDESSFLETKYFEYVLDGSLLTKTKVNEADVYDDIKDEAEIQKAFSKITVLLKERGEI